MDMFKKQSHLRSDLNVTFGAAAGLGVALLTGEVFPATIVALASFVVAEIKRPNEGMKA